MNSFALAPLFVLPLWSNRTTGMKRTPCVSIDEKQIEAILGYPDDKPTREGCFRQGDFRDDQRTENEFPDALWWSKRLYD